MNFEKLNSYIKPGQAYWHTPWKGAKAAFAPFHVQLGPLQVTVARLLRCPGRKSSAPTLDF